MSDTASDQEVGRWEPDAWDEDDEDVSSEENEFENEPIPTGSGSESEGESDDPPEAGPSRPPKRPREEAFSTIEKRGNKNAPMAVSSKKQVSRFRQVVDVPTATRRDPRFSSLSAGNENPTLHGASYNFLSELQQDELEGLKAAVRMAEKAERTCTWAEKAARTAERERLSLELTRLRTRIDRARREQRERLALGEVKREERKKREGGKGEWYMKKGERKNVLLKSRFDELEATGGKGAVKKALEKKRRQVAQKEKKSRPGGKRRSAA